MSLEDCLVGLLVVDLLNVLNDSISVAHCFSYIEVRGEASLGFFGVSSFIQTLFG